jgi:predicted ArsR family transcriptional regulator
MAHTDAGLPFNGSTTLSRFTSHQGAEDAKDRALSQTIRYLALLKQHDGLTDAEAARLLGIERTSVNARRAPLVKAGLVYAEGMRQGPTGIRNAVWKLAATTKDHG